MRGIQQRAPSQLALPRASLRSARSLISARAMKLGETSLFGGDTSSLVGGAPSESSASSSKPKLDEVPLESEVRAIN